MIEIKDRGLILMCAFRYALGRRTYVVSSVVDELIANWKNFDPSRREQYQREIKEHKDMFGNLGMDCDESEWNRILELDIQDKND